MCVYLCVFFCFLEGQARALFKYRFIFYVVYFFFSFLYHSCGERDEGEKKGLFPITFALLARAR